MANSKMPDSSQNSLIDKILNKGDNKFTDLGLGMKESDILYSWKEISVYLDRDVRTCYRWEDEFGLPIHRIDEKSSRSKVFAYKSEIDEWLRERANNKAEEHPSIWKNKRMLAGLAAGSLILAVVFATLYFFKTPAPSSFSGPILVVFPFKNLNSSEYEEYFSEGITNEIVLNLVRLNKIRVIPAVSNDPGRFATPDMGSFGQKLKPDYFLMGELRKEEGKIFIYISLTRAEDNENLWQESFESDQEDIFNISQSISQKIHEELNVDVDKALMANSNSGSTRDYTAYDTYLKGNFVLNRLKEQDDNPWKLYHQGNYHLGRWTPEDNELAASLFTQAIAMDSNYALAYIGLAQCYANYVNLWMGYGEEWLNKAEDLLKKAQQISPDLPEYYAALIRICLLRDDIFNESMGEAVFTLAKNAVEKHPNHTNLNFLAGHCYLRKFGETGEEADFEKALEYNRRGFVLNPSHLNNIKFAELLMLEKEFYQAIEVCQLIERSDSSQFSKFMLGEIYYYLGDLDKSEEIFRQFDVPLNFKIHSLYYLAMINAQKGKFEEAARIVNEIEFIKPEEYRDLPFYLEMASISFGIGDEESGFKHLESLFTDEQNQRDKHIYSKLAELDRNFDKYRNEEKFKNLIRGAN